MLAGRDASSHGFLNCEHAMPRCCSLRPLGLSPPETRSGSPAILRQEPLWHLDIAHGTMDTGSKIDELMPTSAIGGRDLSQGAGRLAGLEAWRLGTKVSARACLFKGGNVFKESLSTV
jgi:hypothetical protein